MESAKNGHRTVAGTRRQKPASPNAVRKDPFDRNDPRTRDRHRPSRADRHASFASEVIRDLNPRGPLERLVADHVVHQAWKLKTNLENQGIRDRDETSESLATVKTSRIRPSELDRASRALQEALEALNFLRSRFPTSPIPALEPNFQHEVDLDSEILPNEWPVVPIEGFDDRAEAETADDDEVPSWRDRLVFDFEVSETSPVVKGTWITVGHVVSLIVDGWAWSDILRSHPELTEDDIRTCVAYAIAEEGSAA